METERIIALLEKLIKLNKELFNNYIDEKLYEKAALYKGEANGLETALVIVRDEETLSRMEKMVDNYEHKGI